MRRRSVFREIVKRRVVQPLIDLLRMGATPRRLAWSLAVGVVIGINPLLGSTTIVSLLAAAILRLNLVASQIANHIMYPLQLLLFFVFIRLGDRLFHTGSLPMRKKEILELARRHPWDTTRLLWSWEWHALIVWAIAACLLSPLLVAILTPLLARLQKASSKG
jgi:uncharacterized protein (DUF2062 family)